MTLSSSILIVDDDQDIVELLAAYLRRHQFEVHTAHDADGMRAQLNAQAIDLVVMDVMLPGVDGFALVREIRARSVLPVIMLSARGQSIDRVIGLESGADDYVCKPFEPRELVARIQSVMRRSQLMASASGGAPPSSNDIVSFDGWDLHRDERTITSPKGAVVPLSNAEFRLLNTFLQSPRRIVSREQLLERARGRDSEAFDRSIDLLVSRLRSKFGQDTGSPPLIKTVRGAGYMFNAQRVQGRPEWRN